LTRNEASDGQCSRGSDSGAFDLGELAIHPGDDVAFCHSIVTVGPADPASHFPVRLTVGLRKIDGEWIIIHEHHSGIGV
jgi:ketosteroid isomerase-like protein